MQLQWLCFSQNNFLKCKSLITLPPLSPPFTHRMLIQAVCDMFTCCAPTVNKQNTVSRHFQYFTATGHYINVSDQSGAAQSATVWASHAFAWATCFPRRVVRFHYKTTLRIWTQMSITTHAMGNVK
jgi:hypothetical protein